MHMIISPATLLLTLNAPNNLFQQYKFITYASPQIPTSTIYVCIKRCCMTNYCMHPGAQVHSPGLSSLCRDLGI